MVAIVDYDAGNIKSVEKALQYIGEHPVITRDVKEIKKADHVIVPGVGAFEDAMEKMNRYESAAGCGGIRYTDYGHLPWATVVF